MRIPSKTAILLCACWPGIARSACPRGLSNEPEQARLEQDDLEHHRDEQQSEHYRRQEARQLSLSET